MTDVKPTRSELIKLKNKIKLAKSGYKLLKKKRDGLILEFYEILNKTKSVRKEMTEKYKEAIKKINVARIVDGDLAVRSVALSIKNKPVISVDTKNIMGVVVPSIQSDNVKKNVLERGYGIVNTSAAINEASTAYEQLLEYIILVAEIETSMVRLLNEIEKTKRRVNALEFEVIPKLEKVRKFIQLRLEELERETVFRSKRIKKKR
ncbi:MAG: V-type ATP synthase subunit D [Candidatus Woesearchaeota archaeon]|nr:V-type ATP synthase subunit D [Candidatus Woesearchaeota archaeon]